MGRQCVNISPPPISWVSRCFRSMSTVSFSAPPRISHVGYSLLHFLSSRLVSLITQF